MNGPRVVITTSGWRKLEAQRRQGRPQRVPVVEPKPTTPPPLSATIAERVIDRQVQRAAREER